MEKMLWTRDSTFIFDWVFFSLADNEKRHKILDEFDFGPDKLLLSYLPLSNKTFPIDNNQNKHKISDKFEFLPDPTIYFGVTCP